MFKKILAKMGFCIIKDNSRSFIKDIIITISCLIFYIGLIVFFLTEPGQTFLGEQKNNLPFTNILTNAFNDINKFLGQAFQFFGLNAPITDIVTEAQEITLVKLLLDLSKLMLSSFIQSLLFLGCSYLFLYAKNKNLVMSMLGLDKKDLLYKINSFLLMGITVLIGCVSATFIISLIEDKLFLLEFKTQHYTSFAIFVSIYVLYSIYSMLTSRLADGGAFSFRESLIKTFVYNLVPEMLTFFITNLLVVIMLNCFVNLGWHILSIGVIIAFLVWCYSSNFIESIFKKWFNSRTPYIGKYCPISGIFWLGGTLCVCLLFYFGILSDMESTFNSAVGKYFATLPFLQDWASGAPLLDTVLNNFNVYLLDFIDLIVICTFVSAFQYFSSSYIPTLVMQIFGRLLILMGCALVCMLISHMVSDGLIIPWIQTSDFKGILIFLFTCIYFIFAASQPILALQGILSAAGLIYILNIIHPSMIYSDGAAGSDMFLGAAVIVIGLGCLLPLIQNIIAIIERKFFKNLFEFLHKT